MKRDVRVYLGDIRESILAIEEYARGLSEEEFYKNRQTQDAVVRRLEVIGEAVKSIDDDFRERYPEIPWKKIAGMRDVLTHEYFSVNLKRVWEVVRTDLPALKKKLALIMKKEKA